MPRRTPGRDTPGRAANTRPNSLRRHSDEIRAYMLAIAREWRIAVAGSVVFVFVSLWERARPEHIISARTFIALLLGYLFIAGYKAWLKEYRARRPDAYFDMTDAAFTNVNNDVRLMFRFRNIGTSSAIRFSVSLFALPQSLIGEAWEVGVYSSANEIAPSTEYPLWFGPLVVAKYAEASYFIVRVSYADMAGRTGAQRFIKKWNGAREDFELAVWDATIGDERAIAAIFPQLLS